jgi:hypothetical protein
MDTVVLLPHAPRGTVIDGFVHSLPLTIHRSMCWQPSRWLQQHGGSSQLHLVSKNFLSTHQLDVN